MQNPLAVTVAKNSSNSQKTLNLNDDGGLNVHVINDINIASFSRTLNITAPTVIKASTGTVGTVSVVVKGTGNGTLNDCATTGAAAASNAFFALDDTVTSATILNFPCTTGIVVVPGAGQTIAISWK